MWHNLVQSPPKSSAITRVDILNASIIILVTLVCLLHLEIILYIRLITACRYLFLRDTILAATIFIGQERNSNV